MEQNATLELVQAELDRRYLVAEQKRLEDESNRQACREAFAPIWRMWLDVRDVIVYDKYHYKNRPIRELALSATEELIRMRGPGDMHGWELAATWNHDEGVVLQFNGGHPITLEQAKHHFIQRMANLMQDKEK